MVCKRHDREVVEIPVALDGAIYVSESSPVGELIEVGET